MAHSLSANKRIRQTAKRRERNRDRKKAIRTETKKFTALVTAGDVAGAATELRAAQKIIDRVAESGTIHKNTAARRKRSLARKLNALQAGKKAQA